MKKQLMTMLGTILTASALSQNVTIQPENQRLVGLAWNASPDASVTGYRIYVGGSSRNYTNSVNAGNNLTTIVSNLQDNATYFFSATAYDGSGVESDFSNEVSANMGSPSYGFSTNINGNWFYQITQTRFTNDNVFRYMQSTSANGWRKMLGATKVNETTLDSQTYVTTWLVPASMPLATNLNLKNDWLIEYENPSRKPRKGNLKEIH